MKLFKRSLIVLFLCICLVYVTNITSIPDSIVIFENEFLDFNTIFGIYIKEKANYDSAIPTSNLGNSSSQTTVTVSLFDIIDLKEVKVNIIPSTTVVPLGNTIGLKLYTSRCFSCWHV